MPGPVSPTIPPEIASIVDAIRSRQRFVVSSHARPDGDSIGSQIAMAEALRALGKDVRVINKDQAPPELLGFPGVADIQIADRAERAYDAVIIMECGDLGRTGVSGLDGGFLINIDHHPGNTAYGQINWFDASAAACGEMVYDLIRALGVPMTPTMATHVYLAILTDTGSFHFSNLSPRTFDICARLLEAGVDPVSIARSVFDTSTLGRLRVIGAVLHGLQMDASGRIAVLYMDRAMARAAGASYDDTEGLINMPLSVKEIQAVAFFKQDEGDRFRISMRSKGDLDIGSIAKQFGGGGHKNAAGCQATGAIDELKTLFVGKIQRLLS